MLMRLLDEQYTRTPCYGARKMAAWLQTQGYPVERKRVRRLLHLMGLESDLSQTAHQFAWHHSSALSVLTTRNEHCAMESGLEL
jgi:hypothetical protein